MQFSKFTAEDREAIAAAWRDMPGATAWDVAEECGRRLGRRVSHTSALRHKPDGPGRPKYHDYGDRRRREEAEARRKQAEAEAAVAIEAPASVPAPSYESPLAGWIEEARRSKRRLGIGRRKG